MDILDKISPNKKERERVSQVIDGFLGKLKLRLKECRILIGGSMGKDSWLSGDHDVDIFVQFPKSYVKKDISKILRNKLKGIKFQVIHGSRDYLQVDHGSYLFEIIPVIEVKKHEEAVNITDVSPLHVTWVKKYNKNPEQVRLTKAFLKANNLYGAESYIKGFSGYVVELLTIHYNGFMNLVKNASNWKGQVIIDLSNFYNNKKEILSNLDKNKINNLILIDPVQPDRNAAASLSQEKFDDFIELCRKYLKNPHEECFIEKKLDLNELKKKYLKDDVIILNVKSLEGKKDIVGSKLLKAFEYIKEKIIKESWKIKESNWIWNKKIIFYYIVEREKLSKEIIHYGPPKKLIDNAVQFRKKWKNYKVYENNDRVYVKLKRKFVKVNLFVKNLIKDKYLKNLIRKINF
jgi:tRNA nucleotidyltransferase (CCA-adding enzyme)